VIWKGIEAQLFLRIVVRGVGTHSSYSQNSNTAKARDPSQREIARGKKVTEMHNIAAENVTTMGNKEGAKKLQQDGHLKFYSSSSSGWKIPHQSPSGGNLALNRNEFTNAYVGEESDEENTVTAPRAVVLDIAAAMNMLAVEDSGETNGNQKITDNQVTKVVLAVKNTWSYNIRVNEGSDKRSRRIGGKKQEDEYRGRENGTEEEAASPGAAGQLTGANERAGQEP
jgi:hypothetical protein